MAPRFFEPDRVLQCENRRRLRIVAGEVNREHAAEGMADDRRAADPEAVEQHLGIACEKIEVVADVGLGRFAETDLVRHDHAIALGRQGRDHVRPVIARKALAMQKHDGLAVCGSRRRDVHVSHAQLLAFDGEVKEPHRIWIF